MSVTAKAKALYKKFQAFCHSQLHRHRVLSRPARGALNDVCYSSIVTITRLLLYVQLLQLLYPPLESNCLHIGKII